MVIPRFVRVNRAKANLFVEPEARTTIWDTTKPFPTHLSHCNGRTWENNIQWFEEVIPEDNYNIY